MWQAQYQMFSQECLNPLFLKNVKTVYFISSQKYLKAYFELLSSKIIQINLFLSSFPFYLQGNQIFMLSFTFLSMRPIEEDQAFQHQLLVEKNLLLYLHLSDDLMRFSKVRSRDLFLTLAMLTFNDSQLGILGMRAEFEFEYDF